MERWLDTDERRSVGWVHEGEHEAVDYAKGRRIDEIKRTAAAALTNDDDLHMRKVVGYVHPYLTQAGPSEDVAGSG